MLVTTTDDAATIGFVRGDQAERGAIRLPADVRVLANQCDSDAIAADVYRRLSTACQRFLSRRVPALPALPRHGAVERGSPQRDVPRVWESPNSPFGHAMLWLGHAVSDVLQLRCADVTCSERVRLRNMLQPRELSQC